MAVTSSKAVHICTLEMQGGIDYSADVNKLALLADTFVWDAAKHKVWDCAVWQVSTVYAVGDIVKPTAANGYAYRCTVAGTSAASEPTWPTTFGNTVTDNGCQWECWSYNTIEEQITLENGYTGPVTLANGAVAEDETNQQAEYTADDVSITASGGTFGPTDTAVIFNDTHAEKPIAGIIAFGVIYTPDDGVSVDITGIKITDKAVQGVVA